MKKLTSSILIIVFILTQCGFGIAAPLYNKVGQNLREPTAEGSVVGVLGADMKEARATGDEAVTANGIGRRGFIVGGLAAAGYGLYELGKSSGVQGPQVQSPVAPSAVVQQTKGLPQPTSELMRKVQDTSRKITEIAGEKDARLTAMWWDTANTRAEDFQLLHDFGFNEVIIDGYSWIQGNVDDETIVQFVIAAQKAGIVSFKFMMGDASWVGEGRQNAIDLTTKLCERIMAVKQSLQQGNQQRLANPEAADILQGIAMDIEPHISSANWNYDLTDYCALHETLEGIAGNPKFMLTYNRIEAFWYSQKTVETGQALRGYIQPQEPVYLMSYRDSADATFDIAGFTGNSSKHVIGFDFATARPTGFQGNINGCPDALLGATNLSGNDSTRRPKFNGVFVHFPKIEDVRAALESWKTGEAVVEQAAPVPAQEAQPATEKSSIAEEPVTAPQATAVKPKSSSFKIRFEGSSKSEGSTTIRFSVNCPAEYYSNENIGVVVTTKTDQYYPQPDFQTILTIEKGTMVVDIAKRNYTGTVRIHVIYRPEYQPQEYFTSPSLPGQLAVYTTSVVAFADEMNIDAQRISSRNTVVASAPAVKWSTVAQAPVNVIAAAVGAEEVARLLGGKTFSLMSSGPYAGVVLNNGEVVVNYECSPIGDSDKVDLTLRVYDHNGHTNLQDLFTKYSIALRTASVANSELIVGENRGSGVIIFSGEKVNLGDKYEIVVSEKNAAAGVIASQTVLFVTDGLQGDENRTAVEAILGEEFSRNDVLDTLPASTSIDEILKHAKSANKVIVLVSDASLHDTITVAILNNAGIRAVKLDLTGVDKSEWRAAITSL